MAEYINKWDVVNRLIYIENEFQQYKPFHGFEKPMYRKVCETEIAIGKTKAADVEPVRHGRWKQCFEDWRKQIEGDKCSACGFEHYGTAIKHYHYCPNCGAKMDLEGE